MMTSSFATLPALSPFHYFVLLLLLFASGYDLRYHKIRNWLVLCVLLAGGLYQVLRAGWAGAAEALAATTVGLLCFLPFYVFKAMGAGDVKLMAALGALLGLPNVLWAAAYTLMAGGVLGLLYLWLRGGLGEFFGRWWILAKHLLFGQTLLHLPPAEGSVAASKFPYAAALACGTLATLLLHGGAA